MTRTWSPGLRWRRLLPWAAGALAFLALALTFPPQTPAQAKKAEPKVKAAKEDKEEKEKEKKEARPEPTIPKVIDLLSGAKGGVEQVGYINDLIAKAWKDNKVQPAKRCTDRTFVRRAFLDIVGRIPTPAEIDRFEKDPDTKRRALLIDRLLDGKNAEGHDYSEEYAQNFATLWTILLMTRTGSAEVYREQMHDWLTRKFLGKDETPDWSRTVTELITASGPTNKNPAVNFVLTHLGEEIKEERDKNGAWDMVPVTSRTTRLFLGIRTQCVQCHDHPFNGEWGQHHFWGINAFYRQVETSGRPSMMAKKVKGVVGVQQYDVHDNPKLNTKGIVPYERRNAVLLFTDPTFLDGKKIKKDSSLGRREELAKFITKSPYFAKAFVNRTWGHFFGKSFTKDAVDDFGEHNPVSHPELLDKLAEDWATKYNYNPKELIRWICNSQAYGLESVTNKYNDKPEDEVFFARMLLKPMTAEQLFESLMTATHARAAKNKDQLKAERKQWLDTLIVNFGNDEGEEASYNGTVVQALLLMNGQDINAAIMSKADPAKKDSFDGTVAHAMKNYNNPAAILDYLYKAALSRSPTQREREHLLSSKMRWLPREKGGQDTPAAWEGYYQDVFWALLNCNEFILNH
jgi:hypothetical protein